MDLLQQSAQQQVGIFVIGRVSVAGPVRNLRAST
jgi:hypothetical protein